MFRWFYLYTCSMLVIDLEIMLIFIVFWFYFININVVFSGYTYSFQKKKLPGFSPTFQYFASFAQKNLKEKIKKNVVKNLIFFKFYKYFSLYSD